jgi:hypothetical protein
MDGYAIHSHQCSNNIYEAHQHIFRPHLGHCVIIYIDGILIFNKTWDEHLHHVVMDLLHTHKLQVKRKKYSFGKTIVHYLGFIISHTSI